MVRPYNHGIHDWTTYSSLYVIFSYTPRLLIDVLVLLGPLTLLINTLWRHWRKCLKREYLLASSNLHRPGRSDKHSSEKQVWRVDSLSYRGIGFSEECWFHMLIKVSHLKAVWYFSCG